MIRDRGHFVIPFDKTGNIYAIVTLQISNLLQQLNRLEASALHDESPLLQPLGELRTEIMLSLDKFQQCYGVPEHKMGIPPEMFDQSNEIKSGIAAAMLQRQEDRDERS